MQKEQLAVLIFGQGMQADFLGGVVAINDGEIELPAVWQAFFNRI